MHDDTISICVEPVGDRWRFLRFNDYESEPFKAGIVKDLIDLLPHLPPPGWHGIPLFVIALDGKSGEMAEMFTQQQLGHIEHFRRAYFEISASVFLVDHVRSNAVFAEQLELDKASDVFAHEVSQLCAELWGEDVSALDLGSEFLNLVVGLTAVAKASNARTKLGAKLPLELVEVVPDFSSSKPRLIERDESQKSDEKSIVDLSRLALRGDVEAIRALLAEGEALLDKGEAREAAVMLKDAAICFRIEAFRQRTRADDASATLRRQKKQLQSLSDWVRSHRDRSQLLSDYKVSGITEKEVHVLLYHHVYPDSEYRELLDDLYVAFIDRGYQFSAPGNSYPRLIWYLVSCALGASSIDSQSRHFLNDPTIGLLLEKLLKVVLAKVAFIQSSNSHSDE